MTNGGLSLPWIVLDRRSDEPDTQVFNVPRRARRVYETYQEDELRDRGGSAIRPQDDRRALLTSPIRDVANAKANPARGASMVGVSTATKAVIPMTALDSRLNRADSQRFTEGRSSAGASLLA